MSQLKLISVAIFVAINIFENKKGYYSRKDDIN